MSATMMISCPSCSTRYDLPAQRLAADGTVIKCASCGYSWLESRAIEITSVNPQQLPAVIDHDYEPDHEVRRLVEANREAQEAFAAQRARRNRRMAGWSALAACAALPLLVALAMPEQVVAMAPASVKAYQTIGWNVNIYGLDFRKVEMQHMIVDGTRVLAVKGEIANISDNDRKIPWIRFALRSDSNDEVYNWTLDSGARPLKSGEITNFVTRVASPPETAKNLEIRFAHANEIGSNAAP
jgi:predicted Zn finger-like uncharacterized protein